MFFWKTLIKIGIISLFLPLNPAFGTATEQLQSIWGQKQSSVTKTFIAATEKQKGTALVIGNSDYQKTGRLPNPVNDATDMAQALRELGFDVILLENATLRQMGEALNEFHSKLLEGGVGVFYYAGHGIQVDGENYLIPIDAKLDRKQDTSYETLAIGKILGAMEDAANNVNIIILDACRDNPFSRRWQRSTQGQGLAPVQAMRGSYIAYATAPGDVAADGDGRNGTFTAQILKHIKTPNLSVEEMFKRVRQDVLKETNNRQIPWDSSSLVGKFSFNQTSSVVATSTPPKESTEELIQQEDDRGGIDKYTQAIALNPDEATAYYNRGNAYRDLKDSQSALADFNKAISIDPEYVLAYYNRGLAYRDLLEYQSALADFNQTIQLNPNYADAYFYRGWTYNNLQQYQSALADFNRAIQLNPNYAKAYRKRSFVYHQLGERKNAIADMKKATELFCQQGSSDDCQKAQEDLRQMQTESQ